LGGQGKTAGLHQEASTIGIKEDARKHYLVEKKTARAAAPTRATEKGKGEEKKKSPPKRKGFGEERTDRHPENKGKCP